MARPTDWSKLGLDRDPTPGSQADMKALSDILNVIKPKVDDMESTIVAIVQHSSGGWSGATVDALKGQISDQLQSFFRGLQQCFDEAAPALDTYLKALQQHQSDADAAWTKAQGLPDKDPGIAQYTQAAKDAGTALAAAGKTAATAINEASGKLANALTPSEIFWEAFQWLALVLGVVGLIFGGPLAVLAWLANIALFIKSIVDFARGDTNFLGLFLGFLGIVAPMTRGLGGDLLKLLGNGISAVIRGGGRVAGDIGGFLNVTKTLFVDFTKVGFIGSIKMIGVFVMKGSLWVLDKILLLPGGLAKIGVLTLDQIRTLGPNLITGAKWIGDGIGKGFVFLGDEFGSGRFIRLFLPVMKDEFDALGFGGAMWRAFERGLPGVVKVDTELADRLTAFQLAKSLNLGADSIGRIALNLKDMPDFKPGEGISFVPNPGGRIFVPEHLIGDLTVVHGFDNVTSLVKDIVVAPKIDFGPAGALRGLPDQSIAKALSIRDITDTAELVKPIELRNLAHADQIVVNRIGDTSTVQGVEKEFGAAKIPTTGVIPEHVADFSGSLDHLTVPGGGLGNDGVTRVQDALSLVKNVDVKGAENIAVRAEPLPALRTFGSDLNANITAAKHAFDTEASAFHGKLDADVLGRIRNDFDARVADVHGGWRDPRTTDPKFASLAIDRLIANLPKQFNHEFARGSWIDDALKTIHDDPGYAKLSIDSQIRFDKEVTARGGFAFDRIWSAKDAAFGRGAVPDVAHATLTADLKVALGKALDRDDWMRKVGASFEHGLGRNADIARDLSPLELAQFRQVFMDNADKLFHQAQFRGLDFSAGAQDRLISALGHDFQSRLADQVAKVGKVRTNLLKGRGLAGNWFRDNPERAALVGDAGLRRLLEDLSKDLYKVPAGSRPQIYNQVLKNFENKLELHANLKTVLSDAAHAFDGAPADAAKFRENQVSDFLSGLGSHGTPHGMSPDAVQAWLAWEKENGDVFGTTFAELHPIDKDAAWSQARIDLSKDFQPRIQSERQIAPQIDAALARFDVRVDSWAEDNAPLAGGALKDLREQFDRALRDAGPGTLTDPAKFDALTGRLLAGLDGRLASDADAASLAGQARLRFRNEIEAWSGKTGQVPSFFGFTKLTEQFDAHLADLLSGARHSLIDGGGLDVKAFTKGLDEHLAGLGEKLDKEAGLGSVESQAFEDAYQKWLGHDVPLDGGFSPDRLTDLADEFRTVSRTLTDGLDDKAAQQVVDDLASRLSLRFDLELRLSSRVDGTEGDFGRGLDRWQSPAGLRGLTEPEIERVRTEFSSDFRELAKVPDSFWTGARWDSQQVRTLVGQWDTVRGDLKATVPGRLDFEARLLDELSHAPELLGDGAKFDHVAEQFRDDFTRKFHEVWGNGRDVDGWLKGEKQASDVFTNGPGAVPLRTSLDLRPLSPEPQAVRPVSTSPVAGSWGRGTDVGAWNKAWDHEIESHFTGKGILSVGDVRGGQAFGGNKNMMNLFRGLDDTAKSKLQDNLAALRANLLDPQASSVDARNLLKALNDGHPNPKNPRASLFPSSTFKDALETINAKLIAETDGGTGGLRPWPFNASAKKPDYLLPGHDGVVPEPGKGGFGTDAGEFYNAVTHVGDHLQLSSVKNFKDIGVDVRKAVNSKLLAYPGKKVRVVVDLSEAPGLRPGANVDLAALVGQVSDAFTATHWPDAGRLIQTDLVVPGHFLAQPHPVVLSFDIGADGLVRLNSGGASTAEGDVFLHPGLPGGGTLLRDGLLLSRNPKDIALAANIPHYEGGFRLVTHFDSAGGHAQANDVAVKSVDVAEFFRSGQLPWREGQVIVVVGCGAEQLAADLRTSLHTPTVGATHDFVQLHEGNSYTGHVSWAEDGGLRTGQQQWRSTPDVLQAGPHDDGALFKLFLPGDLEGQPYRLGSDFAEAMDRLGFSPTGGLRPGTADDAGKAHRWGPDSGSVAALDYLGKLQQHPDGADALKAGLRGFADQVFARHLPTFTGGETIVIHTREMKGGGDIAAGLKTLDTLKTAFHGTGADVKLVFEDKAFDLAVARGKISVGDPDILKASDVKVADARELKAWLDQGKPDAGDLADHLGIKSPLFKRKLAAKVDGWRGLDADQLAQLTGKLRYAAPDLHISTPLYQAGDEGAAKHAMVLLEYGHPASTLPRSTDRRFVGTFGADLQSYGVHIDPNLRGHAKELAAFEAKGTDIARKWRLTAFKEDPNVGQRLKDHLFVDGAAPRRLYFGYSNSSTAVDFVAGKGFVAGHDFLDVVARIEHGTTAVVDVVHVGRGYIDRWTEALGSDRLGDVLKSKFRAAGISKVEVVRFDDAGAPGRALGTLQTGVGDGVTIRLSLVEKTPTLDPYFKASEPLVLVTGNQSTAEALSSGKALLYEGLDHAAKSGDIRQPDFLDQMADWGTQLGGKYSPVKNMLYAFNNYDLFKDTAGPTRLRIVADLMKGDAGLREWRDFSDLMAGGHDANVRVVGMVSKHFWDQAGHGPAIDDAVRGLSEVEGPKLADLEEFEKRIAGLGQTAGHTAGSFADGLDRELEELGRRIRDLRLDDDDVVMHDAVDVRVPDPAAAEPHGPASSEPDDAMVVEPTPVSPYVQDGRFYHPQLPGHGLVLHDSLLLSDRPADIRLSNGVPRYEDVFRLMTHFDKERDALIVNGRLLPARSALDFVTSGVSGWKPGTTILVVGCGAENVADLLRRELNVVTIGATQDVMAIHDHPSMTFTGDVGGTIDVHGTIPSDLDSWTEPPKELTAEPMPLDKATFKLFLPGEMESAPYPLGSDLLRAMHNLGFKRTDDVATAGVSGAVGAAWARDLHFSVGDRGYQVAIVDDEHAPSLQNPHLVAADVDHPHRLQVTDVPGAGVSLGQFCQYLSVHWLTQTDHMAPLGFKDLGAFQDDAVRTVTEWMTGDAHGVIRGHEPMDQFALTVLRGDLGSSRLGRSDFVARAADLPGGTRIVYSTNVHTMAAVLLDDGGVRVYNPDMRDTLTDYPDRQSFLDARFTRDADTFVIDHRAEVPPPNTELTPPPGTAVIAPPITPRPLTSPDGAVLDVDPLHDNPWATPDPDRFLDSITTVAETFHGAKLPPAANPWAEIEVLGRDGKPNGDVYAIDQLNSRWVRLNGTDSADASHLWDGSRGPYLAKGPVVVRPNGDLVLVGEDGKPFYSKEDLGGGRFVEVFRGLDGKRQWFEWRGDGPTRKLLDSGKRIFDTSADGAVYRDNRADGSLARDYRVTLDKGLIRAERGTGAQRLEWVWTRYDKDGNPVGSGLRHYDSQGGWRDTLTFGKPGATVDVTVAQQWGIWFNRWGHALHFRDHTIDLKDGLPGDPVKTKYTYKEISPQDKETGTSEFIGPNRILVVQRVAEQRIPVWFARWFGEIDVPKRGLFGGMDFSGGGVFGGDSRFQIYSWTEHEIAAEEKGVDAPPVQRAGGMRVAIPDGSTFDFMTVTIGGVEHPGVLVRAVVKLEDGTKLEVGRDPVSGKWASLADGAGGPAGLNGLGGLGGRTLSWRVIDGDKKVLSEGIRTFGPDRQWADTLVGEPKTVVRSTDDLGRVTYRLGDGTDLTRDPIGLVTRRTDKFPGGKGDEVVVGSGDPLSEKWNWHSGTESGVRFPFRSHPDLGSWDDSFMDFEKIGGPAGAVKLLRIREIRSLEKGDGLAAFRLGDGWRSEIRRLSGEPVAGTGAIRQWKKADGSWGAHPSPGTEVQVWRDVPVADRGNFSDPAVLRVNVDGKVRVYSVKDGVPDPNVWKEFDHGGVYRVKKLVGATAGGQEIFRETHPASGQWIESLKDGTRIRYRSLSGFVYTRDTFSRWSMKPDFNLGSRWEKVGREYEYRGGATEFRGYNRMWREPNRLQYVVGDVGEGAFVGPGRRLAQKVVLDFLQDYAFDVLANILVTGAVNNWNFSPADWAKIFAGGAVTSGVKGVSNTLQETVGKRFKDGVGNLDGGKFWGRNPYNHDKNWDNEWAGNENPRRWRSGLYDYHVNVLVTNSVASFVSTAFTATVFGVGPHHLTVHGLESLQAGGLGMAGAMVGGLLAAGPRTALHQLGSGRFFHQGGIPDLLITFGEKAFEKWFIGSVLTPGLHLKVPVPIAEPEPWNG